MVIEFTCEYCGRDFTFPYYDGRWDHAGHPECRACLEKREDEERAARLKMACWCKPSIEYENPETGTRLYVHHDPH